MQASLAGGPEDVERMLAFDGGDFAWYSVPCLLVCVRNIVSYPVVQDLGAGVAQLTSQSLMVILITWAYDALARKHVAGSTNLKVLTPTQWTGILMLFLALVVSAGATQMQVNESANRTSGSMVLVYVDCSPVLDRSDQCRHCGDALCVRNT